jgi:cell division protease FtsH
MTQALLDWETLDSEQIKDIMAGRPPRPPKPIIVAPKAPPSDGSRGAEPSPAPAESA